MVGNKELAVFFYESLGDGLYRCKLYGADCKQLQSTGYTNLTTHLAGKHADFRAQYDAAHRGAGGARSLAVFGFVSEETTHRYQWMWWVVDRNIPIIEVDSESTRAMSCLHPIGSKTLRQCMEAVEAKVGVLLEEEMGRSFGLMVDGWSHATINYIGVYSIYEVDGSVHQPLLVLSPLNEGSQDADAHIGALRSVLSVYNKTLDMMQFLVSDNCLTNQSIATKLSVPLICCSSHRFHLAVNTFLIGFEPVLDQVNNLMSLLRRPNNAALLAKHTTLRAVKRNTTRWSSTFDMLQHYVRIRADIRKVEAVDDAVPTGGAHKKLLELLELLDHMQKFESITKRLQRPGTTMAEVRLLFDFIVAEYPIMGEHLKANAKIVHSPVFESAVIKLINDAMLTGAEVAALTAFERPRGVDDDGATSRPSAKRKARDPGYAEMLLRAGTKQRKGESGARYIALAKLIPPT